MLGVAGGRGRHSDPHPGGAHTDSGGCIPSSPFVLSLLTCFFFFSGRKTFIDTYNCTTWIWSFLSYIIPSLSPSLATIFTYWQTQPNNVNLLEDVYSFVFTCMDSVCRPPGLHVATSPHLSFLYTCRIKQRGTRTEQFPCSCISEFRWATRVRHHRERRLR